MALTGGPHLSAARESERGSGPAGVKWAGCCVLGRAVKKEKKQRQAGLGWKEGWVRVGMILFSFFNSFFFISFSNLYSKPFQNF
jgi:hypothetical protein